MLATRARRRAFLLGVIGGAVLTIGWYRRRALDRNTQEFDARYG